MPFISAAMRAMKKRTLQMIAGTLCLPAAGLGCDIIFLPPFIVPKKPTIKLLLTDIYSIPKIIKKVK